MAWLSTTAFPRERLCDRDGTCLPSCPQRCFRGNVSSIRVAPTGRRSRPDWVCPQDDSTELPWPDNPAQLPALFAVRSVSALIDRRCEQAAADDVCDPTSQFGHEEQTLIFGYRQPPTLRAQ
jgi:hypothetical protein